METSIAAYTLDPTEVGIRAEMNTDYAANSGGVKFEGEEYVAVLQGPPFDAYMAGVEVGLPGWAISARLWGGHVAAQNGGDPDYDTLSGTIVTQGDEASGAIVVEIINADSIGIRAIQGGTVISGDSIQVSGFDNTDNWNEQWNYLEIEFEPTGDGLFNCRAILNSFENVGAIDLSGFEIASRQITVGNGWRNSAPTMDPLGLPMQDFRMWSSQRETQLSETPALPITGKELGLQVWLPFDELTGTPVEQARHRDIVMNANWHMPTGAHALDFGPMAAAQKYPVPTLVGLNWTPLGTRNTTVELWVKPGTPGTPQSILSINGTYDPEIDLNKVGWGVEFDHEGYLTVHNGPAYTLTSPTPLTDTWHHVAIVRRIDGTVLLHIDGENVDASPAYSHGKLIPAVISLGARRTLSGDVQPCTDLGIEEVVVDTSEVWTNTLGWFGMDSTANLSIHRIISDSLCVIDTVGYAYVNNTVSFVGGCGDFMHEGVDYSTAIYPTADSLATTCNAVPLPPCADQTAYVDTLATESIAVSSLAADLNPGLAEMTGSLDVYRLLSDTACTIDRVRYGHVRELESWIGFCGDLVYDAPTGTTTDLAAEVYGNQAELQANCTFTPSSEPPVGYDRFFTGMVDELRVWNTALPLSVIRQRMREAVQGYDNLMLYAPFEQRTGMNNGVATTIEPTDAFNYGPWDGYTYFNDDGSLGQPDAFEKLAFDIRGNVSSTEFRNAIQEADAPLIHEEPLAKDGSSDLIADVDWNAMHDEVILQLNDDELYKYEDQIVTFTLPASQMRDELGNSIESDQVFDLLINRNPLVWMEDEASLVGLMGDPIQYMTAIQNEGIHQKYFEIDGLPSWIEATPTSGTIDGGETIPIHFEIEEGLEIGHYMADIRLKGGLPCGNYQYGGFCYGERFTLNVETFVEPPVLDFDPAGFDAMMSVVAKVHVNGAASYDDRDIVAAYIDGELRGTAHVDNLVAGQQLAFVSIFYNEAEDAGKKVVFNVWDASTGTMRAAVETHWPTMGTLIEVTPTQTATGSLFEPLLLNATERIEVSTVLTPGWNWVSFNVVEDTPTQVDSLFKDIVNLGDIAQVKIHDLGYDDNLGMVIPGVGYFDDATNLWTTTAEDTAMVTHNYKVKMHGDPGDSWTIRNTGKAANPLVYNKLLTQGWNSMGYIPQSPLPVEDALIHLSDQEWVSATQVALIRSRYDGFAMYAGNGEWAGSLSILEPGKGYRLYMEPTDFAGKPIGDFEWPLTGNYLGHRTTPEGFNGIASEETQQWPMSVQDLSTTMSAVIRLAADVPHPQSIGDEIGVFATGPDGVERCVGHARPQDTDNGLLYFTTIYGEPVGANGMRQALRFRWMNALTELELLADEVEFFDAEGWRGTLTEPLVLHFQKSETVPVDSQGGLVAYPNPFRDELTIHWHGTEPVVELRIEDAAGRLIDVLDCDHLETGPCRWNASAAESGVYMIHAVTEERNYTVRVIK